MKNLLGKQYGDLIVIERLGSRKNGSRSEIWWKCECTCGKEIELPTSIFSRGKTQCGCKNKGNKGKDLTGKRFGRLVVVKEIGSNKKRQKLWLCRCDCGNEKEIPTKYLTSGDTTSCGCYRKEIELKNLSKFWGKLKIHGLSKTRVYQIWADMKDRCNNVNNPSFKDYGGRGIKVSNEWIADFINFYNWAMENGYKENLTIDRIDVNGNYEPNNCRWETWKVQANNRRTSRRITIYGETKTAYEFEKKYGIDSYLLIDRYDKGYRDDKLIYRGNLGHFRRTNLKRDSKGRYLAKEAKDEI